MRFITALALALAATVTAAPGGDPKAASLEARQVQCAKCTCLDADGEPDGAKASSCCALGGGTVSVCRRLASRAVSEKLENPSLATLYPC